ncbi:MAG: hypothetical protein WAQ07_01200, partial [Candidatus Omnitrophota bacterium]
SLALDKSLDISSVNQLKWNLVISTDLSLTDGNVAACNIPAKVIYINPYFFELPKIKQLQILYHELVSHIFHNEANEVKALKDTFDFFKGLLSAYQGHYKSSLPERDAKSIVLPSVAGGEQLLFSGRDLKRVRFIVDAEDSAFAKIIRELSSSIQSLLPVFVSSVSVLSLEGLNLKKNLHGQYRVDDFYFILKYLKSQYSEEILFFFTPTDITSKFDSLIPYYIFGRAWIYDKTTVTSTYRFRCASAVLFKERIYKQILHELGHTLGLDDCVDSACVMNFSKNVAELDRAGKEFCVSCSKFLSAGQSNFRDNGGEYEDEKVGILDIFKVLGIDIDYVQDQISGMGIKNWLKEHSLFLSLPPHSNPYQEKDARQFASNAYQLKVPQIRQGLLNFARSLGKEDQMRRNLINRKTKRSLYPLIIWWARIKFVTQEREKVESKLFAKIDITNMRLIDMPIWPVDAEGNILTDLLRWVATKNHSPPFEYYEARKVSLYSLLPKRQLLLFPLSPAESKMVRDNGGDFSLTQSLERLNLIQTIINIFNIGQGLELTQEDIESSIVVDTTLDAYRIEKGLPIVIALRGQIYQNCPLDNKPLLMVFTGRGVLTSEKIIIDAVSKLGLAHEGAQLANSMEYKNAIWEIPYHGKKTTFAIQDKDNWVGMPVLYGPEDIFNAGLLMGKGGDRITRLGPQIADKAGISDEDKVFEEYSRALVVGRLLGFSIIDGPDMMRDVDRRMSIMVSVVKETVEDYNANAKRLSLSPIDKEEVLKPTTSNPESEGGFSHTAWMVTSRGVVQGATTLLRWLCHALNNPDKYSQDVVEFIKNLGINFNNITSFIQGFGDVGSGIAKLLADDELFGRFNIGIRGFSNKFFAVYREEPLSRRLLLEARDIVETNPDLLTFVRLTQMDNYSSLKGATIWVANPFDLRTNQPVFTEEEIVFFNNQAEGLGINLIFGDRFIVNELIYQKADIFFPAAGPNAIKDEEQFSRLQFKILCEGANNAILRKLQPLLKKSGILYLPGELLNGGGIYTSKEDIRHTHVDGVSAILANPAYYKVHVTDEIDSLVLHRVLSMLKIWADNFNRDIVEHLREVAVSIFLAADNLARSYTNKTDDEFTELVLIDQARTSKRLPLRHSLYELAVEVAPIGIFYQKDNIEKDIAVVNELKEIREDYLFNNFDICRFRYSLYELMKMSYYLTSSQREALCKTLIPVAFNRSMDILVRKEAITCLAMALKWHSKIPTTLLNQAIKLLKSISSDPKEPYRLHVCSEYALYRVMGIEYLEKERQHLSVFDRLLFLVSRARKLKTKKKNTIQPVRRNNGGDYTVLT